MVYNMLLALLVLSCSNPSGIEADATLTVSVHSTPNSRVRWPPGSAERVTLVNSLDDPDGFAGFQIEVADTAFSAADFTDNAPCLTVPSSGTMTVSIELVRDSRIVAAGARSWRLAPSAEWRLLVNRAPYAPTEGIGSIEELESPRCNWFWCVENWRFPIAEDAANYEYEAIWVTLERLDECADVC